MTGATSGAAAGPPARALRWVAGRGVVLRLVALTVLLAALVAAALLVDVPNLGAVRAWTASFGPSAPVAFALVYALSVPAPVPKSVLNTAAGLAFGIPLGAAVVIVGGTAGAVLAFLIARWLGRDAVTGLAGGHVDRVDALLERYGVVAALAVRFVPLLPFTMLNYACGVTAMRLRHYAVGTVVGIGPGSTALVALGSLGGEISPWVPATASVATACVGLAAGALIHRRRARRAGPPPLVAAESDEPSAESV